MKIKNYVVNLAGALFFIFCLLQPVLQAQEVTNSLEGSQVPIDTENQIETLSSAGDFSLGQEPTFWVMAFLFLVATAVVIERIVVLRKNQGNNAKLVQTLADELSSVSDLDVTDLSQKVSTTEFGLEGRIASAALKGWPHGVQAMQEYSEAAIIAEQRNLDKRLVILSTLGNNVPFIGLLGTVLGIMKAFRDLSFMGDAGPSVVMRGISEALVATAMGLGVAIPIVLVFNALNKVVKTRIANADEIATLLRAMRLSRKQTEGASQHSALSAKGP